MTTSHEDIDYKFLDTMRTGYPALYKMNTSEYSNRDIVANSWDGFCKEMGDISEEAAKVWWQRLLTKYKSEKKLRDAEETKSGSSPARRVRFHLYEVMRDMLASSHTPRPSITNYNPPMTSNSVLPQSQPIKNPEYYDYQSVSGRGRRKQLEIEELIKQINMTIHQVEEASKSHDQNNFDNPNQDIGNLILLELNIMDSEKANEKKRQIAERLFRRPQSD